MPRSNVEVARVELVGSTDLGRGRDRRMERGCDGRREFGQGHRVRARGASGGTVRPVSKGAQCVERVGDAGEDGVHPTCGGAQRAKQLGDAGPSIRTPYISITDIVMI